MQNGRVTCKSIEIKHWVFIFKKVREVDCFLIKRIPKMFAEKELNSLLE